jgi:hypothetical protein
MLLSTAGRSARDVDGCHMAGNQLHIGGVRHIQRGNDAARRFRLSA